MELALAKPYMPESQDRTEARRIWEQHVRRHDRALVVALLARGIPLDRAKDLAQMAWTALWQRHLADELPFVELPGLAIHQAMLIDADERRLGQRRDGLRILEMRPEPIDPDERLLSREDLRQVERQLERLAPTARDVFLHTYGGHGWSHAEIALKMGLSVQRVRHVLCEVRETLRAALEREQLP